MLSTTSMIFLKLVTPLGLFSKLPQHKHTLKNLNYKGPKCSLPLVPNAEYHLEHNMTEEDIEIGQSIQYVCKENMKFELTIDYLTATCVANETWQEPSWIKCVGEYLQYQSLKW